VEIFLVRFFAPVQRNRQGLVTRTGAYQHHRFRGIQVLRAGPACAHDYDQRESAGLPVGDGNFGDARFFGRVITDIVDAYDAYNRGVIDRPRRVNSGNFASNFVNRNLAVLRADIGFDDIIAGGQITYLFVGTGGNDFDHNVKRIIRFGAAHMFGGNFGNARL